MSDLEIQSKEGGLFITLPGRLDAECVGREWSPAFLQLQRLKPSSIVVDASRLESIDGAGIAFLLSLQRMQKDSQGAFEVVRLNPSLQKLLQNSSLEGLTVESRRVSAFRQVAEDLGRAGYKIKDDLKREVSFFGELNYKLVTSLLKPHQIRWRDFWLLAEKAGADAINITILLGFLIGLILAFQSAVAMAQFGAQIYVADLIALTMFKEMAPLITAFILASRSGSAYAAEIGTMKVNEELDALHTFGLDPVRFLAVPRVLALVLVLPLLTLFNNLFALFGAQAVMAIEGFSPIVFWDRCRSAANLTDLFSGLVKTLVFGYFIAAIGCLRGLHTGKGASAVGDSATSAVVTCIIMIVVVDGIFAVIYYALGI
ncbi:MAG: MlaE family lipid ABC transporter permease subunit [Planctomycetota bacterium]|jgi:phospholipid/cholesterol/gamma-HCH transport system permease protein